MKQPAFLWQNARGIYFFRVRIPKGFLLHFKNKEIKISLKTDSLRQALKLARAYRVELDNQMDKLEKGAYSAYQVTLEGKVMATLPNGEKQAVEGKIERNIAQGEDTTKHKEYLLRQLREEAARLEKQASDLELHHAQLSAINISNSSPQPVLDDQKSPTLAEVIAEYMSEGKSLGRWNNRSVDQVEATLNLFAAIVGKDILFNKIDKAIARDFKQKYIQFPANVNKKAPYRDMNIDELLKMEIPESDKVAPNTINNNLTRISTLFKWAIDQGHIEKNPFEGLLVGKKKRPSEERKAFNKDDLNKLFESKEYQKGFKHSYQYWLPIIGLYTGMRLEEICRLQTDNFKKHDGIDCIEIIGDDNWRGKTSAALRKIPIHPKLVELGLLDYVEGLKANDKIRLFEELAPVKGEYGAAASKWFARYRKRCGIDESGKVFHSFRHTLANELKQKKVPLEVAQAILGHESDSMSYGRYGKDYRLDVMKDAILLVDYGLTHHKA